MRELLIRFSPNYNGYTKNNLQFIKKSFLTKENHRHFQADHFYAFIWKAKATEFRRFTLISPLDTFQTKDRRWLGLKDPAFLKLHPITALVWKNRCSHWTKQPVFCQVVAGGAGRIFAAREMESPVTQDVFLVLITMTNLRRSTLYTRVNRKDSKIATDLLFHRATT